jgi:CubicO group peptidase (beta-lactamase class C family)
VKTQENYNGTRKPKCFIFLSEIFLFHKERKMRFHLPLALMLCSCPIAACNSGTGNVERPSQPMSLKDESVAQRVMEKKLDAYLSGLAQKKFSGTALVAQGGRVALHKGYGLADKEKGVACAIETVFDIGSITKQFTAAAILKLEMMGKLNVSDPITKFFPNVPEDKQGITLHHLLTHTAGFAHDLGDDYDVITREEYIQKAIKSELIFKPGAKYGYSNTGYSLLGAIIEKLTGQSYERFLDDTLFNPAGMRQTGYTLPRWKPEQIAVGYRNDIAWGRPNEKPWDKDGPYWNLRANGGILSTAADMYRWHQALEGDKILSAEAKLKLFTPHVKVVEASKSFYGYGWVIETTRRNTTLQWHTGSNAYFYADFRRLPQDRVMAYWATNEFDKVSEKVTDRLIRMALGSE